MKIDADIAGMDGEDMVDEIMTLRQQLENWKQVAFEADQAKGCLEEKVAELEAEVITAKKRLAEVMGAYDNDKR